MALPPSLYADTAQPAPDTPPLDGDRTASVAIIGAGFTGLSAALHLAEQGVDVVVLETHEPGWGASGRNGGQVNPGLKHDPDRVEADFGPDLGGRMVALSGNAPNVVFDLIQKHQIACGALQSGTLRAGMRPGAGKEIASTAEQWMRRGAPVTLLDQDAMRQTTAADRYHSAVLDRRGGQVNPLGYARGLARAAMHQGAAVHGRTPVTRLHKNGSSWHLHTPTGTVRADQVILATNGYTGDLWPGLRRSIVPVYSAIAATEVLPDAIAAQIMPTRSVLYEIGSVTVYYRVGTDNRLLMGGRGVQHDITGPGEIRYLIDYAIRLWPSLRDVKWTHGWNGQLAITPDHYPHIHEPADGVLVCLGYNGRGVAMSSAMGPELAKRALGGRMADIAMPITTIKQMPFHPLWRSGVAARVAYGRIKDAIGL